MAWASILARPQTVLAMVAMHRSSTLPLACPPPALFRIERERKRGRREREAEGGGAAVVESIAPIAFIASTDWEAWLQAGPNIDE